MPSRLTRYAGPRAERSRTQPLAQLRPPSPSRHVTHRNSDSLFLSDQYDQTLTACDAGVERVSLGGVGIVEGADIAVIGLLVVSISTAMTLSPGAEYGRQKSCH